MRNGGRSLTLLALASSLLAQPLAAQTVTNVRATQLSDKTVEVLYDLSGAASAGATVTVAFSSDGGGTYAIVPALSSLSGHVGTGIASGTNRRIVWIAATTLPPQSYRTSYRAAVTATNPSSGGQEITVALRGGLPLVLVRIPAGSFFMGSPTAERGRSYDEGPIHQVTLTSDYYIGKYEVTLNQWNAVMSSAPLVFPAEDNVAVTLVSWDEVAGPGGFINKLSSYLAATGQPGAGKFRLPTEAEWERAARGNTQTRFSFGDALSGDDQCGPNPEADPYVWWCRNAGGSVHTVGLKEPNSFGLHDMHGNVWEWVQDWYGPYDGLSATDPVGPPSGSQRVYRSGSWDFEPCSANSPRLTFTRSAARRACLSAPYRTVGFRLARSL